MTDGEKALASRLDRVIALLEIVAEALSPELPDVAAPAPSCDCARRSGKPISNCPICGGSGDPSRRSR